VYRTLELQGVDRIKNKEIIVALGNVCSEIRQLPTSAIRSGMLEEASGPPSGSGGLTEAGKGKLGGVRVVIKTIPVHGTDNLDPKKVRVCSLF
jgi:hypothetical protein